MDNMQTLFHLVHAFKILFSFFLIFGEHKFVYENKLLENKNKLNSVDAEYRTGEAISQSDICKISF